MTTDQEMQQLADQATDGPWEAFEDNNGRPYNEWLVSADDGDQQIIDWGNGSTKADAMFIAACREWVPDALRRLEAVRELIDPSKAIRGSVASKILKILDGDQ